MLRLVFPHLGHPQCIGVRRIGRDYVAETARHAACSINQNPGESLALSSHGCDLANQTEHLASSALDRRYPNTIAGNQRAGRHQKLPPSVLHARHREVWEAGSLAWLAGHPRITPMTSARSLTALPH